MTHLPRKTYWVEENRLMAGQYPGSADPDRAVEKLTVLAGLGVTHFIDLTFPKGIDSDNLDPYEQLLGRLPDGSRPGYSRHSIQDLGVPSVELMTTILAELDELIGAGEVPYVHCRGGVGRTGTVVGCRMVESGLTPDQAIVRIATLREGLENAGRESPETPGQMDFIRNWRAAGRSLP